MEQSYKEKYEKALERIKNLIDKDHNDINVDDILNVFPELAESEDEKVREEIMALIEWSKSYSASGITNDDAKKMFSWLEKQGEKHPDPYNGTSFEYNGHIWGMCARDNGVEILFDGELKAFLSLEKSFIYPVHPQPDFAPKSAMEANKEEKVDNANKVEPKGYDSIDLQFFKPGDSYCQDNCKRFRETGKCFADGMCNAKREAEQKPEENKGNIGGISSNSEWSEEDEQHIDSLLKRLDALCRNKFERTRFSISEDRDWLKSLRPQNRWKPSDEQMEALDWQVENTSVGSWQYKATKELIADLKKLMGKV